VGLKGKKGRAHGGTGGDAGFRDDDGYSSIVFERIHTRHPGQGAERREPGSGGWRRRLRRDPG
jgi:hypothetical protein